MTIRTAIQDFLVEIEIRKYTIRTQRGYKTNLNVFATYCEEELQITDMDDVDMVVVKRFTQRMIQLGHKGTYINALLKTAKSFIQYCYEEELGGWDTRKRGFKWVKQEVPVIKPFQPSDIRQILRNCMGHDFFSIRDTAIITTFIETGIRCAELCAIQPKDVKEDYIIIRNGKNHKERLVGITPILKKALLRYDRCRESYLSYNFPSSFSLSPEVVEPLSFTTLFSQQKRRRQFASSPK